MADAVLAVVGAGGRLGRLVRAQWRQRNPEGIAPVFLTRQDWDIASGAPPEGLRPNIVLDLAGQTRTGFEANPVIAARVATWSACHGALLLHMSSAGVYAGGSQPMREDGPTLPHSVYGRSKLAAEAGVRSADAKACILRLGNVIGADALIGGRAPGEEVILDPVPGQAGGPVRSSIGPVTLVDVITRLIGRAVQGESLPTVVNIAQAPPVAMADLLEARRHPWRFGPPREGVLARMELATGVLEQFVDLPPATARGLLDELAQVGNWP